MKRLACIALLGLLSGCAPDSGGTLEKFPHVIKYERISYWVDREQYDDGVTCYRASTGISCLVLPK